MKGFLRLIGAGSDGGIKAGSVHGGSGLFSFGTMATLEELEARREALIKKRESLVTRASAGDKTVQYDLTQTDAALKLLDEEIGNAGGTIPIRQVRVYAEAGKGL